ncbi:hypothetical protein V6N11_025722 [Hibiscus sabdariffa]|uniref:Uncharacterized protein n=1 Tax=Hibiscus sabdariffa TaxID=183260 RepID=A0ABR2SU78_9ROSI
MGDCKVNVPTTFPDLVAKSDSRLCKSRVRRFISRRIERLDWPCLGYRHHVATTVRRWNEAHNINMNGGCTVSAQFISFFDGSCSLVALVDRYKVFDKVFDMVSGEVDDVEIDPDAQVGDDDHPAPPADAPPAPVAPPPNDALLAYLEGKFAALNTRMSSIDSSIVSLRTSFDTRFTSLESKIGGIETSIAGFHHEWRTLSHGDDDDHDDYDDDGATV